MIIKIAGKNGKTKLPPKESFYSKLAASGIEDADYEHAENVWRKSKIKFNKNILIFI